MNARTIRGFDLAVAMMVTTAGVYAAQEFDQITVLGQTLSVPHIAKRPSGWEWTAVHGAVGRKRVSHETASGNGGGVSHVAIKLSRIDQFVTGIRHAALAGLVKSPSYNPL